MGEQLPTEKTNILKSEHRTYPFRYTGAYNSKPIVSSEDNAIVADRFLRQVNAGTTQYGKHLNYGASLMLRRQRVQVATFWDFPVHRQLKAVVKPIDWSDEKGNTGDEADYEFSRMMTGTDAQKVGHKN